MRKLMLVLLASASPAFAAPGDSFIDLDKPGALEALQAANAEHHATALRLIKAASQLNCNESTVREATFRNAVGACAVGMFKASYPPKRHVQFWLGDRLYVTNVAIEGYVGKMTPADERR